MTFAEITDPKDLCRDVTNLGHQGNGDVSIRLASLNELPYVMGLVRQSFENKWALATRPEAYENITDG
jgi:predicted transport protein